MIAVPTSSRWATATPSSRCDHAAHRRERPARRQPPGGDRGDHRGEHQHEEARPRDVAVLLDAEQEAERGRRAATGRGAGRRDRPGTGSATGGHRAHHGLRDPGLRGRPPPVTWLPRAPRRRFVRTARLDFENENRSHYGMRVPPGRSRTPGSRARGDRGSPGAPRRPRTGPASCTSSRPRTSGATSPRQIGGDHVAVTSIISDPDADPHQYESNARDAAAVADADVVIVNGLGYDDFVDKLLSSTSQQRSRRAHGRRRVARDGADANPHLWYDVPRIPDVARRDRVGARDRATRPTGRAFAANLDDVRRVARAAAIAVVDEIKAKYPRRAGRVHRTGARIPARRGRADVATPAGIRAARSRTATNRARATRQAMDDLVSRARDPACCCTTRRRRAR